MPGSPGDKRTQFARVAARLREEVTAGAWHLGDQLPSEGVLAERYGVSRGTVVRALAQLRAEGLIMTVHGRGSQIASVPAMTTVLIGPGDLAIARMPEDGERDALGMAPGVPLLVVSRPVTGTELYDGAVTLIRGA